MKNDDELYCILCNNTIKNNEFLSGERTVNNQSVKYSICNDCGIYSRLGTSQELGDFRKGLWKKVEDKVLEIIKSRDSVV